MSITLSQHNQVRLAEFLEYHEAKKSSPLTLKGYEAEVRVFLQYFNVDAEAITKTDCLKYLSYLGKRKTVRGGRPLMANSIKRIAHALSSFYNYLVFVDKVTKNPFYKLPLPDGEGKPKVVMTEAECAAMLDLPCATRQDRMDHLFLEIFYATGARRADLSTAKLADLNLSEATLYVIGKGSKPATLNLSPSCLKAISAYLDNDRPKSEDPHLLLDENGRPYSGNQLYDSVIRSAKRAGITKKVHPHSWRRSMATQLRNRGMAIDDIQAVLRHENPGTTQIYLSENPQRVKKSLKEFHPRQ